MPKQILKAIVKRKNKQGKVFFWARISWFEADGTERNRYRKGQSKNHAKTLLDQLAEHDWIMKDEDLVEVPENSDVQIVGKVARIGLATLN